MTGKPTPASAIRQTDPVDTLRFMFAVGIECSCPIDRRPARVDQLRDTGHYELWQTDLKLVRELGLRYLRYGPPIYRIFLGPGPLRLELLDPVMHEMRRLGIVPIIDLLHFGLPDWLGDFQNPDWPRLLRASTPTRFAERYPWVRYYTPVNEIYVTALFCGAFGWWNERLMSDVGVRHQHQALRARRRSWRCARSWTCAPTRSSSTARAPSTSTRAPRTSSSRPTS